MAMLIGWWTGYKFLFWSRSLHAEFLEESIFNHGFINVTGKFTTFSFRNNYHIFLTINLGFFYMLMSLINVYFYLKSKTN